MKNIDQLPTNRFKNEKEERDYWEARGPLAPGARGIINKPVTREKRSSFLSIRLSAKEITQLRDLASKSELGPSTFAQHILVAYIQQSGILSERKNQRITETSLFEELIEVLAQRTSTALKEQVMNRTSAIEGVSDKPNLMVVDRVKIRECFEVGTRFMALIAEIMNTDIKVNTPIRGQYDTVNGSGFQKIVDKPAEIYQSE
jgi:hypothetical protein